MPSPTAEWYHRTATRDLVGHSALHVAWAAGVADDEDVLALLDRLPRERRQPSLIFSVATWLGAEPTDYEGFRTWLVENWPAVEGAARVRRTQTNEVGRCAPLVAALARIPGPLALLEVGASAGLCAIPERYSYRFGDQPVLGSGSPLIECAVDAAGVAEGLAPTAPARHPVASRHSISTRYRRRCPMTRPGSRRSCPSTGRIGGSGCARLSTPPVTTRRE